MKKITKNLIKIIILSLLVICMTASFTSCGKKLNGTYKATGLVEQTITFKGKTATLSAFGLNVSGEYEIEDGYITITYSVLGNDVDWKQTFEKKGKTIIINGTEFEKQ